MHRAWQPYMNISIYNTQLERVAIIGSAYVSCLWSEGYNTVEDFCLEVIESDNLKAKIKPDFYVGRSDRKTVMVIKSVKTEDGKIIAAGKQASAIMTDAVFVGTIPEGTPIGQALRDAYTQSTGDKTLHFTDTEIAEPISNEMTNKSMLELLTALCADTDTGFRAVRRNRNVWLELYRPDGEPVRLVSRFGDVHISALTESTEKFKNYAVVLGDGEDSSRTREDVDWSEGGRKRAVIVDARDIKKEGTESAEDYRKRLEAKGAERLMELAETLSITVIPNADDFGKRYDLGTPINIIIPEHGIRMQTRVVRFTEKSQNNGTERTVDFGKLTRK